MKQLFILPLFLLASYSVLLADTIYLKDGQEVRGVVVEDYNDRIMISTEKQEESFLKKDIEKIVYDIPELNFVKLAAIYRDKGDYKTALYYYETAAKLNPDMKEAQDGKVLVNNMLFAKKESELKDRLRMKQDAEENLGRPESEVDEVSDLSKEKEELFYRLGISIASKGPDIIVEDIAKNSLADESGMIKNDMIVSVWGKVIKYMRLKDAYGMLLNDKIGEMKMTVSRRVNLETAEKALFGGAESMIGGSLDMAFEGLTVDEVKPDGALEKAGVLKGDRITQIEDMPTRYMPLESVCKFIETTKKNSVGLEIQRDLTLWKK